MYYIFNAMEYLDFEHPIKELKEQLDKTVSIGKETNTDVSELTKELNSKIHSLKKKIVL